VSAAAQNGAVAAISVPVVMDARFGARMNRVCGSVTDQPNADEAAALVQCNSDSQTASSLVNFQNVKIQTGSTRPFGLERDSSLDSADTTSRVMPIRGTETMVTCYVINATYEPAGQNCRATDITKGEGVCYKTTFGDWKCTLNGELAGTRKEGLAGPTTY
jgi:hypothetical protein